MTNSDEVHIKKRAAITLNNDFLNIVSCSGYRMITEDFAQKNEFLSVDASDVEIGKHLREALALSRFVHPDKQEDLDSYLFDPARYQEWFENVNKKYGYKTKKDLLQGMLTCKCTLYNHEIKLKPTHQASLEFWNDEGLTESDTITISESCTDEELGAAARLALSRCTSKFIKK